MNTKTTLILLILVVLLGAWLYTADDHVQRSGSGLGTTKLVPPLYKDDAVTRLEIARIATRTETLVFVKEEEKKDGQGPSVLGSGSWKMEQPVADKADDSSVRNVLSKLGWIDAQDTLEGERAQKAPFGDVEVRLTITRGPDKNKEFTIEIGSKITGDSRYARVAGKPQLYIIKQSDLYDYATKDLFDYRSKDLLTIVRDDATHVLAKVASTTTEGPAQQPKVLDLVRKDRAWKLGGEGGDYADRRKVEELADKVRALRPTALEKDAPSPEDLKGYGLEPAPAIDVSLEDAKGKKERVLLGSKVDPAREVRWARLDGRPFVYKMETGDLEAVLRRDATTFRSDVLVQLNGGEPDVAGFGARWRAGTEVRIRKQGSDWKLDKPEVRLEEQPTRDVLKQLLDLKVASREADAAQTELGKFGLAEPGLTIFIEEAGSKRELLVGDPVKEKPGCFYVKRGEDARVLTAKLDELPAKLQKAPLDLRSRSLFKASHWDAKRLTVTDPDGKTLLEAEKVNYKWALKGQDDFEEEKITKLLETLDDVKAIEVVADVTSESVAAAGLDKPTRVVAVVEGWDKDKKKEETKTLLIGRRDGDRMLAMEQGGPTIARVDAELLDRIARGFKKGRVVFELSRHDAQRLAAKEGDRELLVVEKRDYKWYRGAQEIEGKDFDKLFEPLEKVEGSGVEEATDAKKKERGLAPAWRTVAISIKKAGSAEAPEVKTLLVGGVAGERKRWAMVEGTTEMAVVADDVAAKLDAWLRDHPPAAPKAPDAPKPGDAPKAPDAPKPGDAPRAPDAPKPGDAPKAPDAPKPAEAPKAGGATKPLDPMKAPELDLPRPPEAPKPASAPAGGK